MQFPIFDWPKSMIINSDLNSYKNEFGKKCNINGKKQMIRNIRKFMVKTKTRIEGMPISISTRWMDGYT